MSMPLEHPCRGGCPYTWAHGVGSKGKISPVLPAPVETSASGRVSSHDPVRGGIQEAKCSHLNPNFTGMAPLVMMVKARPANF